jgi:hypothetical protein
MLIDQLLKALPNVTPEQIDLMRVSRAGTIGFADERYAAENVVGKAAAEALEGFALDPALHGVAYFTALGLLARDEIPGDYFSALIADWSAIVGPFDIPLDFPADFEPLESAGETSFGNGIEPTPEAKTKKGKHTGDEKSIPIGREPQ